MAHAVTDDHYPQEEDTTIRNQSYARVSFNPCVSYWGFRFSKLVSPGRRILTVSTTSTLLEGDMYNTLVLLTGDITVTLPAVMPGMDVIFININGGTQAINPNDNDKIRLDGALLDNGDSITQTTVGYNCQLLTEGGDGFVCVAATGTWTDGS